MRAIIRMAVIGFLARLVINPVGGNNQDNSGHEELQEMVMINLFQEKHGDARCKKNDGKGTVMVFFISMPEGI